MTNELMEQLLTAGESTSLDFKRDQYLFVGASDEDKSELLKDILAFANGVRNGDGHILIGVEEVVGARSVVVGVIAHLSESDLQQFVNAKTNRPVIFSYRAYPFEGKQIGILTIPQQGRPIFLNKNFGKLSKHTVYYRQGTTTAVATPDDISNWRSEQLNAERNKEKVETRLGISHYSDTYDIQLEVLNTSEFTIPIKDVALHCITGRTPCDAIFSRAFYSQGNLELQPRRSQIFVLPEQKLPLEELKQVCGMTPDCFWIAVESHLGEIDRVSGELLSIFFQQLALVRENLPSIMTFNGLTLLSKAALQQLASRHPIQVTIDDWKVWREPNNVGAVVVVNRWAKGDIRYSCSIQLRNLNGVDDKLHRLRMEFRKGYDIVLLDDHGFKRKAVDLPSLKWVTLEVRHGLHDKSVYEKSDSIWFCAETVGDNVKHEWQVCAIADHTVK